jgi:uncharacterized protein (TIGR02996 family)
MTVYFVYRSHYDNPTGNFLKKFPEDDTVLGWFQRRWQGVPEYGDAREHAAAILGRDVYGFNTIFTRIAENEAPPPTTMDELAEIVEEYAYVNDLEHTAHSLQVLTDDDELEMAYYFFDDKFLAKKGAKAAYLLLDDWKLPADAGPAAASEFKSSGRVKKLLPKGTGEGTTWLALLAYYDSGNLSDIDVEGPCRLDGVRLPDLAGYLATAVPPKKAGAWPFELALLRSQLLADPPDAAGEEAAFLKLLREEPQEAGHWNVYSDWLAERGAPPAGCVVLERALQQSARFPVGSICNSINTTELARGSLSAARAELEALLPRFAGELDTAKSRVQVEQHVAQLCLHTARWGDQDLYHRWIAFDDLWAAAHPDLAKAILTYARRWDVLS